MAAMVGIAVLIPVPDRIGLAALAELGSRKSTEALQKPRVIVSLVSKHRLRPRFNPFWSWYEKAHSHAGLSL
jgi:hypothetical protein